MINSIESSFETDRKTSTLDTPATRTDAMEYVYETADGTAHRVVFDPIAGPTGTHERVEYRWEDGEWQVCESEPVDLIDVSGTEVQG